MKIGLFSYSLTALAFIGVAAVLLVWRARASADHLLTIAAGVTAIWASAVAYSFAGATTLPVAALFLEIARDAAWLTYFIGMLLRGRRGRERWPPYLVAGVAAACGAAIALDSVLHVYGRSGLSEARDDLTSAGFIILALVGLTVVENLYRNTPEARRWNINLMCFAGGGLFAYDFFLYSHALLFRHVDANLFAARGLANALVAPLLIMSELRNRTARARFLISPRLALHTATLSAAGMYLLFMAAAGYYIRFYGGDWGVILQVAFLFGAILILVVSLSSGSVRANIRTLVEKNFFDHKYDYRAEWLRFIHTVSSEEGGGLPVRIVEAVGNIVDSPDGGVWVRGADRRFALAASWNMSRWGLSENTAETFADDELIAFLSRWQWVVNLDELRRDPQRYVDLALPRWLAALDRAWIIVPLVRREGMYGFIVLGRPRAARQLNWEDYDLLKTVGREAASYLAEYYTNQALIEVQQFENFNRRFAFVVHDIKNLVSQLSLLMSNAEKYGHDAEFQRDMLQTVDASVAKMKRLLQQLHGPPVGNSQCEAVELGEMLRNMVESRDRGAAALSLEGGMNGIAVAADEERLRAVVEHLIQNAIDAVNGRGHVVVRLVCEKDMAVIEVEDNGPGMNAEFVRERLFRPFATTKAAGYGIGAFESREFARAMGGRLDVISEPGHGTRMRMVLPVVRTS